MAYHKEEVLGLCGVGITGEALVAGFRGCFDIHAYDKYKNYESLKDVAELSSIIFLCLPTPWNESTKKIDLSILDENIKELVQYTNGTDKIIVIKSTVVPGTTMDYIKKYPLTNFAFNPEFLRESTYIEDFQNPDRTVIGAINSQVALRLLAVYTKRFPGTAIFRTDPTTAEMVKLTANGFLATIVIYNNIISNICDSLDVSWEEVAKLTTEDRRLESLQGYFEVTSAKGFGGKCFPKDLNSFIGKAKELNVDVSFLEKVWSENLRIRKIRDWEQIPFAISKEDK